MRNLKTFESFDSDIITEKLFVANPDAESEMEQQPFYKNLKDEDGMYAGTGLSQAISFLKSKGYKSPEDFTTNEGLNEALEVKMAGVEGDKLFITINGHRYGYSAKEDDETFSELSRKFQKMLTFSAGRALAWLKKHSILVSGSKKVAKEEGTAPAAA